MKRLLRSVIDFDGKTSQESLSVNFRRLRASDINWIRPADQRVFTFVCEYFQEHLDLPKAQSVEDYFTRSDDVEAQERLKDIAVAPVYTRSDFARLHKDLLEDQHRVGMIALFREAQEVVSKGLIIGKGKQKKRIQGVKDAVIFFSQRANDFVIAEHNTKVRGDARVDANEVWDAYQEAKSDAAKAYGCFTGLEKVDTTCHGCKRGELWLHAAFAGELKCLPGDATVFDHAAQRRRTLRELYDSGDLPVVTGLSNEGTDDTWKLGEYPASHLESNGVRRVYDLTLASGRALGATSNHKFFTPSGWVELGSLKAGDWVAVPSTFKVPDSREELTPSEAALLGYLIGDGSIDTCIRFTNTSEPIREDVIRCLSELGYEEKAANAEAPTFRVRFPEDRAPYVAVTHATGEETNNKTAVSPLRWLLEAYGLWGTVSESKHIPAEFFGLSTTVIAALLGALWSTDGSCHTGDHERSDRASPSRRNDITYGTKSERLAQDVQALLLRLSIQSTVHPVDTLYNDEPYRFWVVRVVGNVSKLTFACLVRVVGKEDQFQELRDRLVGFPVTDDRRLPSTFIPDEMKVPVGRGFRYSSQAKDPRRTSVTYDTARLFGCQKELEADIGWEQVESVEYRGEEETFDLSVPEAHTFVANDILTHNTTFALNWCYNLVTHYRRNVFYASFEMTYEQLRRQVSVLHSANLRWGGRPPLDYRKVRDGELTSEEEAFLKEVLDDWENNPEYCRFEIWTPDHDVTMDEVRMEVEIANKSMEVGLLVLDHGGLMEPRGYERDYTIRLNSIIRDAKKLALHFNTGEGLPVCLLFQINREGKEYADKNEGKYKMRALAYANEAERSADYVTTSYLNEQRREEGNTVLCNLKNRENPLFETHEVAIDFSCRRLHNMDISDMAGDDISIDDMDETLSEV